MKILHAADFHLDSPFHRLEEEKALLRREELRRLPARLAALAVKEAVDLVLLPGDLFDGDRVYPETVEALTEALASIPAPVFIAPGNHDHCRPGSPYLTAVWPDNVHIFTDPFLTSVDLPELNCTVHGCAFTSSHREGDPIGSFTVPADGRIHLLCVHGEVAREGRYAPIDPRSLASSGVTYAALGHVHTCSGLCREGGTAWAYPGCPEGRGFDEPGPRGCLLTETDGQTVTASFHPLSTRQYRVEEIPLSSFRDSLPPSPSPDLVRILLTGETGTPPDLPRLTALAADRWFHAELRDATVLPEALWARTEEDSLTGLFLREMSRRLSFAPEEEHPLLILATRFGLAALEGREDVCP